jgi:hypothetical protein
MVRLPRVIFGAAVLVDTAFVALADGPKLALVITNKFDCAVERGQAPRGSNGTEMYRESVRPSYSLFGVILCFLPLTGHTTAENLITVMAALDAAIHGLRSWADGRV